VLIKSTHSIDLGGVEDGGTAHECPSDSIGSGTAIIVESRDGSIVEVGMTSQLVGLHSQLQLPLDE
jgi:hypothetical protein